MTIFSLDEELPQNEANGTSDTFTLLSSEKLTGAVLVGQQFIALYGKRFYNSKRNIKGFFCEVLLFAMALKITINSFAVKFIFNQRSFCLRFSSSSTSWLLCRSMQLLRNLLLCFHPGYMDPQMLHFMLIKTRIKFGQVYMLKIWWMKQAWAQGAIMMIQRGKTSHNCDRSFLFSLLTRNDCLAFRMNCFSNITGLLNPSVNPANYEDFRCPCSLGIATCPANLTGMDLPRYRSVSTDQFHDVTGKDIDLWVIGTYRKYKKLR